MPRYIALIAQKAFVSFASGIALITGIFLMLLYFTSVYQVGSKSDQLIDVSPASFAKPEENFPIATMAILLFSTGLIFTMKHYLNRIAIAGTRAKEKINTYATLTLQREEEIETLLFVLSKSEQLMVLTDREGKIIWINNGDAKLNNYSERELRQFKGRALAEVSHYPQIQETIALVLSTKKKTMYQAKSFDRDGGVYWSSTTVTPIMDANEEVQKLLFIDADITAIKKAEEEIEKMAGFVRDDANPALRIEAEGIVSYCNQAAEKLLNLWHSKTGEKIKKESITVLLNGALESQEEKQINVAVEKRLFRLRFVPAKCQNYVNVYGEDITESGVSLEASDLQAKGYQNCNLNFTDSLTYARRIQQSILPGEDQIRRYFNDAFALSMPRDIVSGDFFWVRELQAPGQYLLALADCTGHGVPGAMMSIVGHSLLNEIVESHGHMHPAEVLEKLNTEIIRSLRQKTGSTGSDGMDIAIMHIDLNDMCIHFAGAYQGMYLMNGKLNVYKGDRMPIGGVQHDTERHFSSQTIKIAPGNCIYLMTDGFMDQFGGPDDKKFLSHRIRTLIEKNHHFSMQAQSHIFKKAFEDWKGGHEQVDDVSIIGIKF